MTSIYTFKVGDKVRLKGGCEGDVLEVIQVIRHRCREFVSAAHETKGVVTLTASDFEKSE